MWSASAEPGSATATAPTTTKYATVLISRISASRPTPRKRSCSRSSSPDTRPAIAPQRQSKDETTPATIQGMNPRR
ncbi:hypothetical protein ACFRFU_05950 [Streptomyces sp. NPDC056704]|uniref:hypothetical protein n=1 Tax=Streptomyces TaxID=1883 RepID=UPI0036A18838